MTTIHPTAVVEDGAQLGADCQIGPFVHVGPHVTLGPGCILQSHVVIDGHTTLGEQCEVYSFACLGKRTQDLKFQGGTCYVNIGSRNQIREYVTINAATADGGTTRVGDDCLIQSYCHIAHECQLGNQIIMTSGAMIAGHVEVGDHAVIMGNAGAVPFARIGTMSLLGGYAKLTHDALPYCICDGSPAEPRAVNRVKMERLGFSPETIRAVHQAYRKIMRSGLPLDQALAELEAEFADVPQVQTMIAFARASERGLARPHKRTEGD